MAAQGLWRRPLRPLQFQFQFQRADQGAIDHPGPDQGEPVPAAAEAMGQGQESLETVEQTLVKGIGAQQGHAGLEAMPAGSEAQLAEAQGCPDRAAAGLAQPWAKTEISGQSPVAAAHRGLGDRQPAAGLFAAAGESEGIEQAEIAQELRRAVPAGGLGPGGRQGDSGLSRR